MRALRSHGMIRDPHLMRHPVEGAWYYEQHELGFNYRITDLQCALGLSQLKQVDQFVKKRHERVAVYQKKLADLPLILPYQNKKTYSAFHLYVIQIDSTKTFTTRKDLFEALRAADIGVNVHYIPVHLQPYYAQFGFKRGDFPVCEHYYDHAITLPLYASLSEREQDYVVFKLKEALHA
jgi:dTDP-4-amino-4,6-dideoxygalactose transaminase